MEGFVGKLGAKVHVLRLDPGDLLLESIQEYAAKSGIKNGYVVSGVATLSHCVLHMVMTTGYPAVEHFEKWEDKPLEVAGLSGVIADGIPHLHVIVSDHKNAVAGHVEPGCRILYLGEIVIQEIEGIELARKKNSQGINMLSKL